MRIILESYDPFVVFRDRLSATDSADNAAQQTRALLNLSAHREEIKDSLISLGTYSNALRALGGGKYTRADAVLENSLNTAATAASVQASAEAHIRTELGASADQVSRQDVLLPLASALQRALSGDAAAAVTEAGKAVESFLAELAGRLGVSLVGANGIGQKLDKFRVGQKLPKKIIEAAKYLGQVRNAADHGRDIDPDVNSVWTIQKSTGLQFVYVACSFIAACYERERSGPYVI